MEIKTLQQMLDLNSNRIVELEEEKQFYTSLAIERDSYECLNRKVCMKITRLAKLQKLLKQEIAARIEDDRKERAYEAAAEGLAEYCLTAHCERVRGVADGNF